MKRFSLICAAAFWRWITETGLTRRILLHARSIITVGHVTEALLRWWYRRSPEDAQGLPEELKPIFTQICVTEIDKFRAGRILLAANVVALFRVDRDWARTHLLPLFDGQRSATEARVAWDGFLWSPRLYHPLLEAIKQPFLETAGHYESLAQHAEQYAALLTFAALDRGDTFSISDVAKATRALPSDGLVHSAETLARALESAGDQRADYWANRILPYLQSIWPKSLKRIMPGVIQGLARLCVAAQEVFPKALDALRQWFQPLRRPDDVVYPLP